jgi:hypothetical protein
VFTIRYGPEHRLLLEVDYISLVDESSIIGSFRRIPRLVSFGQAVVTEMKETDETRPLGPQFSLFDFVIY